jgi:hypothetical protein
MSRMTPQRAVHESAVIRPGGRRLLGLTTLGVAALAFVALLALPGEPRALWAGLQRAAQMSSVLIAAAVLAAVTVLACLRTWSYRRLQYLPGPIQVLGIEDASDGDGAGSVARFDVHFRQTLSELRLLATTPAPGVPTSTDFVELLETSNVDAKQPFAVLGRVLRIVRPTHAYEVRATLIRRAAAPCFGAVVEVSILPGRRTTLRTYWRESWEAALERAATGVAAEVIPRSRHSDSGVWARWKGLVLEEELVDLYQEGERLRETRRFEESLARFYEAVRRDPSNGHLRLALGATQEELALHIDALLTYSSIPLVTRSRNAAHPDAARRLELVAGYRYANLLGLGEGLATQWLAAVSEVEPSRRSLELRTLRERLRPVLLQLFSRCAFDPADLELLAIADDPAGGVKRILDDRPHLEVLSGARPRQGVTKLEEREREHNRRLREYRLQLVFQLLAEREIEDLVKRARGARFDEAETGLTPLCFELLPAWADVRLRYARDRLLGEVTRHARRLKLEEPAGGAPWPPAPDELLLLRPGGLQSLEARLNASCSFVDHYAAARIHAVGLLPTNHGKAPAERRAALAEAAVEELRRAVDVGGSAALAARWDGILSSDPDLASLRTEPAFERFETEWLPSARSIKGRPRTIARLNASRYNAMLCAICAHQLEKTWQARAATEGPIDIAVALRWLRYEVDAWRLAAELAHHHRHWQTRLKVIEEIQRFNRGNGGTGVLLAHPRYADDPLGPDQVAGTEETSSDVRMKALAVALGQPGTALPGFDQWGAYLHWLDRNGKMLQQEHIGQLAENRAMAWRIVRQVFEKRSAMDAMDKARLQEQFTLAASALETLPPPGLAKRLAEAFAAEDHLGLELDV